MYITLLLARLGLAALFLIAAVGKLLGGFASSRKSLTDFGAPSWLVAPLSIALPCVELGTACLLIPAGSARIGAVSALALLLIFNAAIAANLVVGKTPNCNCLGQLHSAPIGWRTFARNGTLAILAGWVAWQARHYPSPSLLQVMQGFDRKEIVVTAVALLAFAAIAAEGLVLLQFFQQNGRLLLRIEALEARSIGANFGTAAAAAAPVPPHGLRVGSAAPRFDLPNLTGGTTSLIALLSEHKPLLLIFTSPNCGPCNALMPDVSGWQNSLAAEVKVVLISDGRHDINRAKAAEYQVRDVLVERSERWRRNTTLSARRPRSPYDKME